MQSRHASLAFGVEPGKGFLCRLNSLVADVFDQFVRRFPRLFGGLAHDHVQADAELHFAPMPRRSFAHVGEFFRNRGRRFAPGQIDIDLFGGQIMRGIG
ncbi:hypothetical protein D3C81_1981790 [compost metagenome]